MLRTAARLLGTSGQGEFILAFEGHVPEAADRFWSIVEDHFAVEEVESEDLDPKWQDTEFIGVYILRRNPPSAEETA
jgi:hypothetical protein